MSKKKKKKKKKKGKILFLGAALLAVGGVAAGQLWPGEEGLEQVQNYKPETVRRGTVSTGISEDGTAELGTTEQIFTVAEITEVSLSGSSDESSTSQSSSSGNNSGLSASGMGGGFPSVAGTGQTGSGMESMGGIVSGSQSSSQTETSAGEDTSLVVEEVYVAAGQAVKEGDPVLKITQESIASYQKQLEAAVESASLQVAQEEINVESKRAEAEYTYQMYLAEGKTAEETYQATIDSLETAVSDLEEELADAQEEGDEDEIEAVEAELKLAENDLTTQSLEAKQTYENAMTNYKYADKLYEIDTNGLEDDLEDARELLAEAEENLEDFKEQIGDGIVYAEHSGTVTEVAYAPGDTLSSDAVAVTFTDAENVTMTVSVSQEDISQIAVGDEASISLTAYENQRFSGEVTSIETSSTSGSSTVNYDVGVRFTGDVTKVYSGMTGEVTFVGKSVTDTLYISNRAVSLEGGRSYVKVLEQDGTVRKTEVTTGSSDGSIVAVKEGLEEGQEVIIESRVVE